MIFSYETLKHVVTEEYGDGSKKYRVTFTFKYRLFETVIRTTTKYDKIPFPTYADAVSYAENVYRPSKKCSEGSYSTLYFYKIYTNYDNNIFKKIMQLWKLGHKHFICKQLIARVLKYTYNNTEYINYCFKDDRYLDGDSIPEVYEKINGYLSEQISSILNEKRKEQLKNTIVAKTTNAVGNKDVKAIVIPDCEEDINRNKLIKKELERTAEYTNFLKSLLK